MLNNIGFIEYKGGYYVQGKARIVDTLFKPINGRTASGYYKEKGGVITLYNPQGEKVGEMPESPQE